jgi:hypothetical protein
MTDISMEVSMHKELNKNAGLKMLLKRYQKIFRIPENLNYYSEKDFRIAEKKFVKHALVEGKVSFIKSSRPKS